MKNVLVIQEEDTVIGVASNKEKAIELILEYFGEKAEVRGIRDVQDSGIEFTCVVIVGEDQKNVSDVVVYYFDIDQL